MTPASLGAVRGFDVCWSIPADRRRFDLSDPDQVTAAYEFVLDGASRPPT
jgi:hypothetical protein